MEHVCKTLGCYLNCLSGVKFTQKELAGKLGASPQAVNYWINDKKRPTKDNLLKLCLILHGVPEKAFKLAGYEIDPLEKSWFVEMQVEETPLFDEYQHMKRQLKGLRQLMKGTDLKVAVDFAVDLRETLRKDAQKNVAFLPLLFDVLDNLSLLYIITCSFDDMEYRVKPVIAEMKQIQQEINDDASLGRLLSRQGMALPLFGLKKYSDLYEPLKLLNKATKLMNDPNLQIETLWLSCLNLCRLGETRQFDSVSNMLESRITELGSQIDPNQIWVSYEKLAVANATMWERFQDERYLWKSKEMFDKAKVSYDLVHRNGDSFAQRDICIEQAELRLADSRIIKLTEEEKLNRANNIMIKSEKIGDPKIAFQMKEYIASQGKNIPDIAIIG